MSRALPLRLLSALLIATVGAPSAAHAQPTQTSRAASTRMAALMDFLRSRNSTGFVVLRDGVEIIHQTWPAPADDPMFAHFVYGHADDGMLLEDVASQQKSFVAVLVGIAVDRGLISVEAPVSTWLGVGWSGAAPGDESRIRVIDLLNMSSGLDERFQYVAPAGETFFYNTPVYAATKRVLSEATGLSLEALTEEWLTRPAGMTRTAWRQRPAALASVGNATGLVTTPRDVARFGQMILDGGLAADGTRVMSEAQVAALFERSPANPAYGRLWWLNGGQAFVRADGRRVDGALFPSGPPDLVAALGAFDRKLYVVPSRRLVVVRTGAATHDPAFDALLWRLLDAALE